MNSSARIALLLAVMIAAVLLAPVYMSNIFGGIAAGLLALGVIAIGVLVAAGAIVFSAAGILAVFLGVCFILVIALSPILVPVALVVGFIYLIVRLASRPNRSPPASSVPTTPAPIA